MTTFKAVEFKSETVEETGRVEIYVAKDLKTAVQSCLYTKRLVDGRAYVGPTGAVVHVGKLSYSVVKEKKRGEEEKATTNACSVEQMAGACG